MRAKKVINEHTMCLDDLEQQVTDLQDRRRCSKAPLPYDPYQRALLLTLLLSHYGPQIFTCTRYGSISPT